MVESVSVAMAVAFFPAACTNLNRFDKVVKHTRPQKQQHFGSWLALGQSTVTCVTRDVLKIGAGDEASSKFWREVRWLSM